MYHPPRADFSVNCTQEESAAVNRHYDNLKDLHSKKLVLMAGRVYDARFGIALLETESQIQARDIMLNDPAVKAKAFKAELLPFKLALK